MLKKILLTIAICSLILPSVAMAQDNPVDDVEGFKNVDFMELLTDVIQWALGFVVLLTVIMIIYGGFKMITSQGEPEGFNKGRDMVIYAIIGLIVAFVAWGLVSWVQSTFFESTSGGTSFLQNLLS